MYLNHEVLGTDKPIYANKQEEHLIYEEILLLDENPNDYEIDGFLLVNVGRANFQALYKKKG